MLPGFIRRLIGGSRSTGPLRLPWGREGEVEVAQVVPGVRLREVGDGAMQPSLSLLGLAQKQTGHAAVEEHGHAGG